MVKALTLISKQLEKDIRKLSLDSYPPLFITALLVYASATRNQGFTDLLFFKYKDPLLSNVRFYLLSDLVEG